MEAELKSKNHIEKIQKRDGRVVDFVQEKITNAIHKAIVAANQGNGEESRKISDRVLQLLNRRFKKGEIPAIEQIQDIVEEALILEDLIETAKAYILYRDQRRAIREASKVTDESSEKVDSYLKEIDWQVKENANMTYSLQGLNQYVGSYISKKYWLNKIYPKEIRDAASNEDFHIHNLELLAPYTFFGREVVIVKLNGKLKLISFKDLYDEIQQGEFLLNEKDGAFAKYPEDLSILDKNGWVKVSRMVRKKKEREMRFIKSEQGRSVIVTDNHPFIVKNGGVEKEIDAKDVKEKEDAIFTADVVSLLKTENLFSKRFIYLAEELLEKGQQDFFLEGFDWRDFVSNWGGSLKALGTLSVSNSANSLDNKLELTADLGYLVGIFIAEGNYHSWRLEIKNTDTAIIEKVRRICSSLGLKTYFNEKESKISINCSTAKMMFERVFQIKELSKNKNLPPDILNYNLDFIKGIVAGIIDGDGSVRLQKSRHYDSLAQVLIRVSSRTMLEQLSVLLQFFGIIARDRVSSEDVGKVNIFQGKEIIQNYPIYGISFSKKHGVDFPSFKYQQAVATSKYWRAEECGWNKVLNNKITTIAEDEIFDITTESRTFICNGLLVHNCAGWDLYDFLIKGFGGVSGKIQCTPPKHFRTALGQLVNVLFTLQGETAGANAVSNFDTLLAPFIRYDKLDYKQVKQSMQEFLYNCMVPTRVGFQSLTWDELVVVKERGRIKFKEIGDLVDKEFEKNKHRAIEKNPQSFAVENHDDYYALSFDENGKAVWGRIKAFVRHKVPKNSEFVKIKTNRGEAKVSKAHSLFSFKKFDGKFNVEAKSSEDIKIAKHYTHLNEDNHFIALKSFENFGDKKKIDLVEILDEIPQLHKNVFVKINPSHTLDGIRQNILTGKQSLIPFYKEFGLKDRGVWKDWLEKKSIRYEIWRKYGNNQNYEFKLKNSDVWYPRFLEGELLENFVKTCAWYITEGHTAISTPLYVSQSPSDNAKEIMDILEKMNALGEVSKNKSYSKNKKIDRDVLKITGAGLLSEIISRTCGYLSFNKVIPSFIFELSPKYQKIFFETLLKGDASEYKTHWDFDTTSKKLSLSLCLLLSLNRYRFSVYSEETSEKNKNWHDKWKIRVYKKNYKPKTEYFINDFKASACLKVEKFKYDKEFEYDISVDLPQENFVGGSGLLAFHNTPFLNVSLDIKPPEFLAKQPVIIGGLPQNEIYGEFQPEIDMFIKAFYEGLMEGDASGRPFTFPIPTVSVGKDFEWDNHNLSAMWEATAKYGINYFSNFIHSDMSPEDFRSMCCRLRLSNKELYKRGGGLFGSQPLTGSIGVVTINLPRIGYLSKTKTEFFSRLSRLMDLAKGSLEIKRKALDDFMEKGLYPYSRYYLEDVKKMRNSYFGNHFSTIGIMGMNESLSNFLGEDITTEKGRKFALEILDFMRERMIKFQEETGNLYNLEATPGEGTSYRQAKTDKERYPDIITAGTPEVPYYTNSSQLPVGFTDDVFQALDLQDDLQKKYTGGCVAKGNKVLTNKGLLPIEDIVKDFNNLKPIKALSYNKDKKISEWDNILEAVKIDVKKHNKIRVKGERGLDIVTSDWHPFFVLKRFKPNPACPICETETHTLKRFANHIRWNPDCGEKYKDFPKYKVIEKRADELKEGDYVLQNSFNMYSEKRSELGKELAWLFGFFIGDGSISKYIDDRGGNKLEKHKIRFFSEHKEATGKVAAILNKHFGAEIHVIKNDKRSEKLREVVTSKKEVIGFFFKYGFWAGKKCYNIVVPDAVKKELAGNNVFSFLSGLMDSDGHLDKKQGDFEYYTVSEKLADDVLEICSIAGIMIAKKIKKAKKENEVDIWRLRIPSYEITKIRQQLRQQLENTFNLSRIDEALSNRKKRYLPVVRIKEISKIDVEDNQFYDLMTQKNHNYLAGKNTLVFIHNTVLHLFLGEKISDPNMAKSLVKKIFEKYSLPYITLTPTFSICPTHGYLTGEHFECPQCTIKQPCEVYSRVVGYIRPVQQWHKGKQQEYKERKEFAEPAPVNGVLEKISEKTEAQ